MREKLSGKFFLSKNSEKIHNYITFYAEFRDSKINANNSAQITIFGKMSWKSVIFETMGLALVLPHTQAWQIYIRLEAPDQGYKISASPGLPLLS